MALKQMLKRMLLPNGLRIRTIRGGGLKGMRMWLDLQDNMTGWRGLYEECLQKWIIANTKPGAHCLDIGGSDGNMALLMARQAGPSGRVFTFEPGDRFDRIARNIELNSSMPLAAIEPIAAYVGAESAAAKPNDRPFVSIDQMIADGKIERVDVVKIDVDGPEVEVLKGMSGALKKFKPHLFVEVHSRDLHKQVEKIATDLGYTMELEMPHKREYRPSEFNAFYFSVGK